GDARPAGGRAERPAGCRPGARATLSTSTTAGRPARPAPPPALFPGPPARRPAPAALAGHARDLRAVLRRGADRAVRRLLRPRGAARGVQPDRELRREARRRGAAASPAARARGVTVKRALAIVGLVLSVGPAASADAQRRGVTP